MYAALDALDHCRDDATVAAVRQLAEELGAYHADAVDIASQALADNEQLRAQLVPCRGRFAFSWRRCDCGVKLHQISFSGEHTMTRQSISFTPPNDAWLKAQVESKEFASKSDVVNDLIRKAREIEAIRAKLIAAEQSGFTTQGRAETIADIKDKARRNGAL
ncbi:MAG: ribbon-helix-helix domain-containing protein [Gammaproteobacteria bacterium]